jgi:hypothetical protein
MGQLDDLKASLADLDDEQILEMVRKTRANRRISKKKAPSKKAPKKPKESIEQVMAKMTDDDRNALLAKMAARIGGSK